MMRRRCFSSVLQLLPRMRISPASGFWMPSIISTRVVFPAPFGPRIATYCPLGISRLTPRTALHVLEGFRDVLRADHRCSRAPPRRFRTRARTSVFTIYAPGPLWQTRRRGRPGPNSVAPPRPAAIIDGSTGRFDMKFTRKPSIAALCDPRHRLRARRMRGDGAGPAAAMPRRQPGAGRHTPPSASISTGRSSRRSRARTSSSPPRASASRSR